MMWIMRSKAFPLWALTALCFADHCAGGQQVLKTESPAPPAWTEIKPLLEHVSNLRVEYRADLGLSILRQAQSVIPRSDAINFMNSVFDSAHTARYQTSFFYAARDRDTSSEAIESNNLRIKTADALSISPAWLSKC